MVKQAHCLLSCAAHLIFAVNGQDDLSLVQQSVSSHSEVDAKAGMTDMQQMMGSKETQAILQMAPQLSELMSSVTPEAELAEVLAQGQKAGERHREALSRGWKSFFNRAHHLVDPTPEDLLHHAKLALLETGAMTHMRQLAATMSNASRTSTRGAVPMDSMQVGFGTSIAPWNNILKMFGAPLAKVNFDIFTNFFGPQGNAARLCISSSIGADSTYGVHTRAEFGGISVWIGPAKWDNVPGWSFGTGGGFDDVRVWDVADFGWKWTLARTPETVGFYWDILLLDDETLHAGMLQTGSEVQAEQESRRTGDVKRHGTTYIGHTWCSPDWANTPLVLPDDVAVSSSSPDPQSKDKTGHVLTSEEWDPESEAV